MQGGKLRFLDGGGDAGRVIRSYAWDMSPLGPPEHWPTELRTLVGVMLAANQPMFVAWGQAERLMIYNDAYAAMIGNKHPNAIGSDTLEVFAEVRDELAPLFDAVYRGEAIHMDDIALDLDRDGVRREAHFAFSYTPVRDDAGLIVGLFCAVAETTADVVARQMASAERARLAGLFRQSPSFMAVVELPDYRFTLANPAYETLAGRSEIVGKTFAEVLPDAVEQGFLGVLEQVCASGKAYATDGARYDRKPDPAKPAETRFCDVIFQPIFSSGVTVSGIFIEGYDVTNRRVAEDALRESEARFRAAVHAVHGVLWTNTADGEMVGEQPGWAALTGQSQTEYEGYGWADAIHPDDARPTIDAWREAVGTQSQFDFEHRVRRHDGEWRHFAIRAIPALDDDGTIREWIGLHTDVTDQRAAAQALLESEAKFRGVAEALPCFVWTADELGLLTYTSPRWQIYSGSAPDDSNGVGWASFVHPDDQPQAFAQWHRSVETGEPYEIEMRLRGADGVYHWWLARAQRHLDGSRNWIGTATELDAIVAARDTLARSREELERLVEARTAELREAEEQLRQSQKLEAIGQLTGGVAHDFNNLLTVIRGSVDLLRRPGITEDRKERYIEAISDTVTRAAKLTGQLLAFARRQTLKPDVFDVGASISGITDMIGTLSGSRIRIEIDLPDEPLFVDADPSQFDTAIVNLAANARDAMSGEGTLTIGVRASGASVAVSVTDTGSGIAPEVQAQIFEPFFTTKGVGQGTGLGLSQVYGFAMQSGGDVQLKSAVGEGATFTLSLPRVTAPANALPETSCVSDNTDGQGICVLVVEDNPEVGMFAKQTLAELGFATVFAENGPMALAELAGGNARIDVVFSDVMMPGMTGLELGEEIRRRHPELPVVLTSGYSHVLAQHGSGGFDLLQKPYSMDQLSQTLQNAARRRLKADV